jgi:large subunit ribosomal protein L10e
MVRKPNRMYRRIEGQSYTRQEYMGGIPHCRISQFDTGNPHQTYRFQFDLVAEEAAQVQDKALEAARVSMVRVMDRVASNNFHVKVRKFPHHILREHKMATGAGADRISDGMRLAFGKPVGHAVRANIGDILLSLSFRSENLPEAKEAVRKAASKLPTPVRAVLTERKDVVEGARAAAVAPIFAEVEKKEAAAPEAAAPAGSTAPSVTPAATEPPAPKAEKVPSKKGK